VPGNRPAWFGPGAAGKGPARCRHLASGLPVCRLKDHGFIQRIPHSHRYRVTDTGLARAMFLARAHDRLLLTGLAELTAPTTTSRIQHASRTYQAALDDLTTRAGLRTAA
jgi:hypothetical protein